MEAVCSSETSVETQRTTRRHIPEDDTLQNHRCENLKSYKTRSSVKKLSPTFLSPQFEYLIEVERNIVCMRNEVNKTVEFEKPQCVGITDGRDLCSTPLRRPQVA
jgi:hypothetical protein